MTFIDGAVLGGFAILAAAIAGLICEWKAGRVETQPNIFSADQTADE